MIPVALVVPPWQSVVRPNLGVSRLAADLAEVGILARVHYLNMEFAALAGVRLSDWLAIESDCRALLGEWVFCAAAAGDEHHCVELPQQMAAVIPPPLVEQVLAARELAAGFVADAAAQLALDEPLVVGMTTSFHQTCAAVALAREVKRLRPDTITCLGGGNCAGSMGRALAAAFPQVDHVFSGECDDVFPAFVQAVLAGASPGADFRQAAPVEELDRLPPPDFSDYFATLVRMDYAAEVRPGLLFESSRGCWWGQRRHCRFCGVNGTNMTFRARAAERVAAELSQQRSRWGVRRFEAADNILGPGDTAQLFDELAAGEESDRLDLFYEVRSNMSHAQLLRAARGGLTWVQAGIEGLDDELLRKMDKGVTGLDNIRFLRDCQEIGIHPLWIILHSIPGEDPEAYRRMTALAPLLEHLPPPERCYAVRLDRHSPYQQHPRELGFSRARPADAYGHVFGFLDPALVAGLAYYFQGAPRDPAPAAVVEELSRAVERWQQRFFAPSGRAELTLSLSMGQHLVTDSRHGAGQGFCFLEPDQHRVLSAFRRPARVEAALAATAPALEAPARAATAFGELTRRGYLIQNGDRAVSVVVEDGHRVHGWDRFFKFPGGYLARPGPA